MGYTDKKNPDMHKRERERKNYVVGILILYSQMGGGLNNTSEPVYIKGTV